MNVRAIIVSPWRIIIGEHLEDLSNGTVVAFKRPIIIEELITEKGMTLMPIPMGMIPPTGIVLFNYSHIICDPYEPPENMTSMYIQATTGLVMNAGKELFKGRGQ